MLNFYLLSASKFNYYESAPNPRNTRSPVHVISFFHNVTVPRDENTGRARRISVARTLVRLDVLKTKPPFQCV